MLVTECSKHGLWGTFLILRIIQMFREKHLLSPRSDPSLAKQWHRLPVSLGKWLTVEFIILIQMWCQQDCLWVILLTWEYCQQLPVWICFPSHTAPQGLTTSHNYESFPSCLVRSKPCGFRHGQQLRRLTLCTRVKQAHTIITKVKAIEKQLEHHCHQGSRLTCERQWDTEHLALWWRLVFGTLATHCNS